MRNFYIHHGYHHPFILEFLVCLISLTMCPFCWKRFHLRWWWWKKKNLEWYSIFHHLHYILWISLFLWVTIPWVPLMHRHSARHISTLQIHCRILWANDTHMQQPITDLTELLSLLCKYFLSNLYALWQFWIWKCLLSKFRKSEIYLPALMLD